MEVKKSKHADLERSKSTFLLMGFVFAFAVIFVALEWTQGAEKEDNSDIYGVRDLTIIDEEMIPITLPEKKTVQPPPQSTSKAEIIEIIEIAVTDVLITEGKVLEKLLLKIVIVAEVTL